MQADLIAAVDADFGVYEGTTFKEARFAAMLEVRGIAWPRWPTGRLKLDVDTLGDQVRRWPELRPLRELRATLGKMRLAGLPVGADGRNRCPLWAFGSVTRGVVSGEPEFFKAAFGSTAEEFEAILLRPHHMIFNRRWFEFHEGRGEFDDYLAAMRKLSASERAELVEFLSTRMPGRFKHDLGMLSGSVLRAAHFYVPMERERELEVRKVQRVRREVDFIANIRLSPAEIVEDAGLEDLEFSLPRAAPRRRNSRETVA